MTDANNNRDVVLIWLPKGSKATGADFANGEQWNAFDDAVVHARETVRKDGHVAWIRCDQKFVLSPEDIAAAYPDVKRRD